MKKLLILFISVLCLSCSDGTTSSVYNYPNGVIVDRSRIRNSYSLSIRYGIATDGTNVYKVKKLCVPKLEYDMFETGDTVKVEKYDKNK